MDRYTFGLVALALLAFVSSPVVAQDSFSDDFEDGNFDGWTLQNNLSVVGVVPDWTITDGVVRMFCPPVPVPDAGPARAFMYLPEAVYANTYVAVDIVEWNDEINQAFGIFVRQDNIGLGQTTGYIINYNPNQTGSRPWGQFQINRVINEGVPGGNTLAVDDIELVHGRSYRMVAIALEDRIIGMLFDRYDLTRPVSRIETQPGDDRVFTYAEGTVGLFNFYRGGDVTADAAVADFSFDNFHVSSISPEEIPEAGISSDHSLEPRILSVSPPSEATFASGFTSIVADVAVSPENPVVSDQIILTVNGDIESGWSWESVQGDEFRLTLEDAVEPDELYHVRLELPTTAGITAIQEWHFDTVTEDLLKSDSVVVVEAEDYNFGADCDPLFVEQIENGGLFIDNPPVSGLDAFSNIFPDDGTGYVLKAGLPDFDFFDLDEPVADSGDSLFRACDGVATRDSLDFRRSIYLEADLLEQDIFRTEVSEWTTYTRTFRNPSAYNVYLRTASLASNEVEFAEVFQGEVGSDALLVPKGSFKTDNFVNQKTYRFVPLTDDQGNLVRLEWTSEEDIAERPFSFRLTVSGDEMNAFNRRFTLFPNYLAFVRAEDMPPGQAEITTTVNGIVDNMLSLRIESDRSTTVTIESSLSISPATWQTVQSIEINSGPVEVTLPLTQDQGFFRVSPSGQ